MKWWVQKTISCAALWPWLTLKVLAVPEGELSCVSARGVTELCFCQCQRGNWAVFSPSAPRVYLSARWASHRGPAARPGSWASRGTGKCSCSGVSQGSILLLQSVGSTAQLLTLSLCFCCLCPVRWEVHSKVRASQKCSFSSAAVAQCWISELSCPLGLTLCSLVF